MTTPDTAALRALLDPQEGPWRKALGGVMTTDDPAVIARIETLADEWSQPGAASGPFPGRQVIDVDMEVLSPLRAALAGGDR